MYVIFCAQPMVAEASRTFRAGEPVKVTAGKKCAVFCLEKKKM